MKNILLLLVSIISITLFSCENATVTPGNYPIVGTWKYTSDGGSISITRIFNPDLSYMYRGVNNISPNLNLTLTGTYESDGTNLKFKYSNGETDTATYTSTEYELILTMSNEHGPTVYSK